MKEPVEVAQKRVDDIARELAALERQRGQFKWITGAFALASPLLALLDPWYVPFGLTFAASLYVVASYIGKLNVIETEERLEKARAVLTSAA
jgi:hypothetical protein